jgi:phosphoenolpyruvate carboxykinase (ATP)
VLDPRNTWTDKSAYDAQAKQLAAKFTEKYKEFSDKQEAGRKEEVPRPATVD